MSRQGSDQAGFGVSDEYTFTIPNGATGANVEPVNLGRNYLYIEIACDDAQYIQAATTMSAQKCFVAGDTMRDVYEHDDPGTKWVSAALPTTGTFSSTLVHALGAQYIRIILSKAASGGAVVLKIRGFGGGIK